MKGEWRKRMEERGGVDGAGGWGLGGGLRGAANTCINSSATKTGGQPRNVC